MLDMKRVGPRTAAALATLAAAGLLACESPSPAKAVKTAATLGRRVQAALDARADRDDARTVAQRKGKGGVILDGKVESRRDADELVRLASTTSGVDRIRVVRPHRDDAELTAAVEAAFANEPATAGVHATVANGVVRLTGVVARPEDRKRAHELARSVRGVIKIEGEIDVRPNELRASLPPATESS